MDKINKYWTFAITPICLIALFINSTMNGWVTAPLAIVMFGVLEGLVVWNLILYRRQLRAESEIADLKEGLRQYSEERDNAKAECERRKGAAINIAQHMVRWSNTLNGSIGKDLTTTRHACREVRQGMLAHLVAACNGLTTPWFLSREDASNLLERTSGGIEGARKAFFNIPEGEIDLDNN